MAVLELDERYQSLVEELLAEVAAYNPNIDRELLGRAFSFAARAHEGQQRRSGEDFIHHPYGVALILASLKLDEETIAAALLHDVVEDTDTTLDEVKDEFGEEIAKLVDGVTKLTRVQFQSREQAEAENYRKMIVAMAEDVRVILIKLADRLHNMRTIEYLGKQKQVQKAKEVLEVYAPLAHRLGIHAIKWELEDLSFQTLHPRKYEEIKVMVAERRADREEHVREAAMVLKAELDKVDIAAEISGRAKHFYSIYDKMARKGREFNEIYDLTAMRVIAERTGDEGTRDCYGALGLIHSLWKPMPGRFKDFVAMPKVNRYRSLHTTVIGPEGRPLEIQLRTRDMHETAELGIAAHWAYKSGKGKGKGRPADAAWRDWEKLAKSSRARNKIRAWFSRETRADTEQKGREALEQALKSQNLPHKKLAGSAVLAQVIREAGFKKAEDFYLALGSGKLGPSQIVNKVIQRLKTEQVAEEETIPLRPTKAKRTISSGQIGVNVQGVDDVLVRLAKCCTPVPGDEIVGYISLGKGITIHRDDCPNVKALKRNPERFTPVEWEEGAVQRGFRVQIAVYSWDRPRLLEDVARTFAEHGANIVSYGGIVEDQLAKNWYTAELGDVKDLRALLTALRNIEAVFDAYRVTPS